MFRDKNVLDCGSLDINGSTRGYFDNCNYIGIDLLDGPGVDIVTTISEHLVSTKNEYDVIISTEALEHDENWEEDVRLMVDHVSRTSGSLIVTTAGPKRAEHMTPRTSEEPYPWLLDFYTNHDLDLFDFAEGYSIKEVKYGRGKLDVYYFLSYS